MRRRRETSDCDDNIENYIVNNFQARYDRRTNKQRRTASRRIAPGERRHEKRSPSNPSLHSRRRHSRRSGRAAANSCKTGGVLAAGAFGAVPLRGWAADPDQYRRALSDHRQHGADRRRLRRRRQARGRDGQRGRRHQVARRRQAQPDHLRRAERHHGDAHRDRPADHRQQAVGDPRLLRQRADADRERSLRARQGADHHRLELRPAQQGPQLHLHAVRPRLAIRQGAVADVEAGQRQAEGRRDLREHRVRHLDLERPEGAGAGRRRRDRDVRALFGRLHRCEPADQQGQGVRRQRAVLGVLSQRPHPDRAHRQAGRPQRRDQRRLRRLRDSGFLQERRQARRGPAGRRALEPRHETTMRRR